MNDWGEGMFSIGIRNLQCGLLLVAVFVVVVQYTSVLVLGLSLLGGVESR